MGGRFTTVNGVSRNGIARLNSNGSLDAGFAPAILNGETVVCHRAASGTGKSL